MSSNTDTNPTNTIRPWLRRAFVVTVAVFLGGCGYEEPVGLDGPSTVRTPDAEQFAVNLAGCDSLRAPEGSKLAFHAYATGAQIYRWSGAAWTFVAPSAGLFANAGFNGEIGAHYAGPTWESVSGSKVVGAVLKRCPGEPNAIPWLLLGAVTTDGPGVFHKVTYIQRVNTVGGNAPAEAGSLTGELVNVPYTAEYFFYR